MYISEMFQTQKPSQGLNYDLKDDLVFFMNNDSDFYRKRYYPTMVKFESYVKNGHSVSSAAFKKLVTDAYDIYKEKFPVEGLKDSLDEELCEKICEFIHESEFENCKNSMYS